MKRTLLSLWLSAATLAAAAQTLQPWKINLPVGQAYFVSNTVGSKISQQMMGQQMDISNTATTEMVLTIQSADAEGFRVEQTISRMKIDMAAMGMSRSFDSSNPQDMDGPMADAFKAMLNSSMEGLVAPNGKVTILKKFEMPEGFDMGADFDGAAPLASYFVTPPSKPVRRKGSWTENIEQGSAKTQITYTFLGAAKGQARLGYEMTSDIDQTVTLDGVEAQSKLQVKGKGSLVLELATGLVLERRYEGTVSGISETMGMQIPQEITQKMVTLLAKK